VAHARGIQLAGLPAQHDIPHVEIGFSATTYSKRDQELRPGFGEQGTCRQDGTLLADARSHQPAIPVEQLEAITLEFSKSSALTSPGKAEKWMDLQRHRDDKPDRIH
jgi:hypothetical protein